MDNPVYAKMCSKCGGIKPQTEFHRDASKRDGYYSSCKRCCAEQARRYATTPCGRKSHAAANAKYKKTSKGQLAWWRYTLKKKYGLTVAEYERIFEAQGGVCAICDKPQSRKWLGRSKWLCVDHDHKTGRVRGLLCCDCNTMLGLAHDDTATLGRAIKYLEGK